MGQMQTFGELAGCPFYPPEAEVRVTRRHVRQGPIPDSCVAANKLYSITSSARPSSGSGTVRPSLGCLEIDDQLNFA